MKASREEIRLRTEAYVEELNKMSKKEYEGRYGKKNASPFSSPEKFGVEYGNKYAKIVRLGLDNKPTSVHSFINRTTGDILKAASYKAPAKHARGSVLEEDYGFKSAEVTLYGVRYL